MTRKNQVWNWGIKTKTDAGRVSQYTSPLQRNVSLFSQAIGGQANGKFLRPSEDIF
jgi:hypothetical protein